MRVEKDLPSPPSDNGSPTSSIVMMPRSVLSVVNSMPSSSGSSSTTVVLQTPRTPTAALRVVKKDATSSIRTKSAKSSSYRKPPPRWSGSERASHSRPPRAAAPPTLQPLRTVPSYLQNYSSEGESSSASRSRYPGRKREFASTRVPVPLLEEPAISHGGFLDDMSIHQPSPSLILVSTMPSTEMLPLPSLPNESARSRRSSPPLVYPQASPEQGAQIQGRKNSVRFKLGPLAQAARGVQKFSSVTAQAIAKRASTGSGTGDSSTRQSRRSHSLQPSSIDVSALHAGPGGIFEPDPDLRANPTLQTLLQRANSYQPMETSSVETTASGDEDEVDGAQDPAKPAGLQRDDSDTLARRTSRPRYPYGPRRTTSRRRRLYTKEPPPWSLQSDHSHNEEPEPEPVKEHPTFDLQDPAREKMPVPPNKEVHWGTYGQFQPNRQGFDLYAESDSALSVPSGEREGLRSFEPIDQLARFADAVLALPWRSKSHVTVSYIPPNFKPDGTNDSTPWYKPRKDGPARKGQPGHHRSFSVPGNASFGPHKTSPASPTGATEDHGDGDPTQQRPTRYIPQIMVPGIPIQIISPGAPGVLITQLDGEKPLPNPEVSRLFSC